MILRHSTFLLIILNVCQLTLQTPSPYSLQPAVEALSEREAQLALRDEIENGNLEDFIDSDDFEWNNDYDERGGRGRALARYLSRTDYDDPDYYRKRSMYRKRDSSVFRERARLPQQQHRRQQQAELAERFLKAIEEEREKEREEEYRDELKNLWNRYQKEESNIERELFNDNENDIEPDYPLSYEDDRMKKKKRQRGEEEIAPYWNDKRSIQMPLLPWLPAQRKKRFPVTKRSAMASEAEMTKVDKVDKDLQGIFGNAPDNKKIHDEEDYKKKRKRSSDEMIHQNDDKSHEKNVESHQQQSPSVTVDDKKRNVKRSADDSKDDEDRDIEEADDYDSLRKKMKKKKREAKRSLESIPDKRLTLRKKSLEWSNIFGFDRKKKSNGMVMLMNDHYKKRSKRGESDDDEDDYSGEMNFEDDDDDDDDGDSSEEDEEKRRRRKKRSNGQERLDAMDRKLKTIENLIVEDTAKFYEHNNDNLSPSEYKEMKNQLADRLATAYSIEKMRKAIGRLRQSIAFQKNLERNLLEREGAAAAAADDDEEDDDENEGDDDDDDDDKKKKAKRVAIKKEKAEFDNNDHEIDSPMKKTSGGNEAKNDLDDNDDDDKKKKKKKKRSQKKRSNVINVEPPMSEGYMGGGSIFQSECPILDSIEKRCRGIDILSGAHQNLLEACGEHQLCYLCGDSELQCDYKYIYEVKEVCGYNSKCKINAEKALELLRRSSGSKVGPRECIRNPCLNSALRSIGY